MKISNPLAKNAFEKLADTHSLVYSNKFVEDAHTVVRGVTLSNDRRDENLVIGNIDNHDIQLLQRTVKVRAVKGDEHTYKLAIMHMILPSVGNLPHIFLDGNNRYHEAVYQSIFTKFSRLVLAPQPYSTAFSSQYRFFTNPENIGELSVKFPQKLTDKLSLLGHVMDYELLGDSVYVYLPGSTTNEKELSKMLSALRVIVKSLESPKKD